jgi:hypothetical protein
MANLSEDELRQPSTALYYAILLSACGQTEKATRYRVLAERGPLLPEERALLTR